MAAISRRDFLQKGAAAVVATLGSTIGPFAGLSARAATAGPKFAAENGGYGPLIPLRDLRDGVERLFLPEGFKYRSFGVRNTSLTEESTLTPGRHDGMAVFSWKQGKVRIVRNREADPAESGSRVRERQPRLTILRLLGVPPHWADLPDRRRGQQLGEPQRHDFQLCGWRQPVGDLADLRGDAEWDGSATQLPGPARPTGRSHLHPETRRLVRSPGFRGEPGELEVAEPIRSAGRFAHEAAAVDPTTGDVYMTEDDSAYASGFYRYRPPNRPKQDKRIADGGVLEILGVIPPGASEPVTMDLHADQAPGATHQVGWIRIENPDPAFAPGLSNDEAARVVFQEGESNGAARFSRLEGMDYFNGKIFFVSTEGGGPFDSDPPPNGSAGFGGGYGQVWMYDISQETLTLVFESPGPGCARFPRQHHHFATS